MKVSKRAVSVKRLMNRLVKSYGIELSIAQRLIIAEAYMAGYRAGKKGAVK